jgi:G6PDH family F420-dependent oxidoreductase
MTKIGFALSSEEHTAQNLVANAKKAEELGFDFAFISDHFHPWTSKQGQSPFVWSVLGGIAQQTKKISVGTGVTAPIIRVHPAIIAQAAATVASMMEGRFILGLGTGENLNEHIVGEGWPPVDIRQDMLIEAVEIIRFLWEGGLQTFYGNYYTVEDARIYSLPKELPLIFIAASGNNSAEVAGKIGDGLISTSPDKSIVTSFEENGGKGKPKVGQLTVSYAKTEEAAIKQALEWWPNGGLKGKLSQELRIPSYFEEASQMVTPEMIQQEIVCGPDPKKHLAKIDEYVKAGFDHIYIHQVGSEQEDFFEFYKKNVLPVYKK